MPTVLIYWAPGRNARQKENLVRKITDALVEDGNARREDILIIFQNIEPGDAGRAGVMLNPVPTDSEDGDK
jgi:4-oxalocrotonate tautomerase family enzyme